MRALQVRLLLCWLATPLVALPSAVAQDARPSPSTVELEAIGKMIERGELAAAEPRLRSAASRFQSVRALLLLARLQSGRGDLAGALDSLKEARALAPNSEEVLRASGETLLAAGETLPAIGILDALTRVCPTVARYRLLLGTALTQVGDAAGATEPLLEAVRLEPSQVAALIALGSALNARGQYQEARPHLLRAQTLAPDNVEAIAALAEAEAGLGELEAAEAAAQRALAKEGAHPRAHLALGTVRLKQERYAEARDALLKATAADTAPPKAHYQLSLAYAGLHDEANAKEQLELYRRRTEETEERVDEVRRLTGFSPAGMER